LYSDRLSITILKDEGTIPALLLQI